MQANLACMRQAMSGQVCQGKVCHDPALNLVARDKGRVTIGCEIATDGWSKGSMTFVIREWQRLEDIRLVNAV